MEITLKIDDFEGPLDLLLHLIKEKKMDLLNLKIEIIIDEYLNFIEKMEKMNLDIASSYLVMASELLEMKSKLLLPNQNDEEDVEEDPKERLINRLVEYQRYKDLTEQFRILEKERKLIYTKIPEKLDEYKDENINITNSDITIDDLMDAFKKFLERKGLEKPLNTRVTTKEISVEEKIIAIRKTLKIKNKVNFFDLFDIFTKEYVVATFLAILEMAKKREIKIFQENRFGEIICEVNYE